MKFAWNAMQIAFWLAVGLAGCNGFRAHPIDFAAALPVDQPHEIGGELSQLTIEDPNSPCEEYDVDLSPPDSSQSPEEVTYLDLTLEEAVRHALDNSHVLRELGGAVIIAPDFATSVYDPAIIFTDPRFGEEAALSAFDATFAARAFFDKNDRRFNNTFIGTAGLFQQDLGDVAFEIRKRAATGTEMAIRHAIEYDYNNNAGNLFGNPSGSYQALLDGEIRQPLLQGSGLMFNRIAGGSAQPGLLNGVLLARVRSDISLAEFETGVRDLVSNVENAYWDLYFAYRDLDAKKKARDNALETYQQAATIARAGRVAQQEVSLALEQYWRFEAEVLNALNGRLEEGTRTNNGSGGGTGRAPAGVYTAERRLRLIIGMPVNGGQLIRPSDEPSLAPTQFDWAELSAQAIALRPELRRQRWRIKQRELERIASQNFLLPRLDAVARYRFRGFGEALISQSDVPFSSAYGDLADGDYQEWQLGVELEVPLGYRRGHAAVRNAEHALARERAILREQKRQVIYGISTALGEVQRAYSVAQAQYNRWHAANEQVKLMRNQWEAGSAPYDYVLEAQRRLLESEILYYQARVDYALAIRNVHYEQGTLLAYNGIALAEGPSPAEAYHHAAERDQLRSRPINYVCHDAVISAGPSPSAPVGGAEFAAGYPTGSEGAVPPSAPADPAGGQPAGTVPESAIFQEGWGALLDTGSGDASGRNFQR
jgi:outer membrane protein TolC